MSKNSIRISLVILRGLYIFTILGALIALRLELDVMLNRLLRAQVDTLYMLDCIIASVFILNAFAFFLLKRL